MFVAKDITSSLHLLLKNGASCKCSLQLVNLVTRLITKPWFFPSDAQKLEFHGSTIYGQGIVLKARLRIITYHQNLGPNFFSSYKFFQSFIKINKFDLKVPWVLVLTHEKIMPNTMKGITNPNIAKLPTLAKLNKSHNLKTTQYMTQKYINHFYYKWEIMYSNHFIISISIPNGFRLKKKKKNEDPFLKKAWSFYPMEWPFPQTNLLIDTLCQNQTSMTITFCNYVPNLIMYSCAPFDCGTIGLPYSPLGPHNFF